jgi:hypothetical protein
MPGAVEPRDSRARLALLFRILAIVGFLTAAVFGHWQLRWILLALAGGLALVLLARRRKAAVAPGALFACSADQLVETDGRRRRFPGELSVTQDGLVWAPSSYSSSHGREELSIPSGECAAITLRRDGTLLGVTLAVRRTNGEESRFVTHSSRGLTRAVSSLRRPVEALPASE